MSSERAKRRREALGRRRFLAISGGALTSACAGPALTDGGARSDAGADGGTADGGATDAGGASSSALTLAATRLSAVAPAGILFTAEAVGFEVERAFHDLRYRWSFSDPGEHDLLDPDIPWGRDRDVAFGPVAAHAFESPGSYDVVCEATDGAVTARSTVRIEVLDPDVVFRDATVCISVAGDFVGAPPGAMRAADLVEAQAMVSRGGDARFLFRRGETHTHGTRNVLELARCQVGAFGDGAAPRLATGVNVREAMDEVSVWGLELDGPYDVADPANTVRPSDGISLNGSAHATIFGCRLSGWSTAIRPGDLASLVVANTRATNWFNFGLLQGDGGWVGLAGVSLKQNPLAVRAPGKAETTAPFHADHGPFRLSRPRAPVCMNLVDLFTCTSWNSTTAMQPNNRWNSGGVLAPQRLALDRVRSEGAAFSLGAGSADALAAPMEIVVDKFHHLTTMQPTAALVSEFGGVTFRNGIVVQADVPPESSTGLRYMHGGLPAENQSTPENYLAPTEVYSCTLVDLRSDANAVRPGGGAPRGFRAAARTDARLTFENNLLWAPNLSDGDIADGPVDETPRWDPSYVMRRVEGEPDDPRYANPRSGTALFAPTTGSRAIRSARGRVALDDFFGELRGEAPSRGAIEP